MSLTIGDKAPLSLGKDQDGKEILLSDFSGKKIILYFYPKDNTPGCTAEACSFRDNYQTLQEQGYVVIGVSKDSEKSHRSFIEKKQLPFILIADTELELQKQFDVWREKKMYGKTSMGTVRTTFLINEQGIITDIIEKVNTKDAANQILNGK